MDVKMIGQFLAQLRKEKNLTQEQLGEILGVTNKTVSRWENGNYMPPVEMLKSLSELYGLTINEMLSGQRLDESEYQEKAEENIAAVMTSGEFSRRERLYAAADWIRKKWWIILLCLAPGLCGYSVLPFVISEQISWSIFATWLLVLGLILVLNHVITYIALGAYCVTKSAGEFRPLKIMRIVWLIILTVNLFVSVELLCALLYALTPAGTSDGYQISSMFYDVLIADEGNYLNNCWIAFQSSVWQTFSAAVVNFDLAVLWMKKDK